VLFYLEGRGAVSPADEETVARLGDHFGGFVAREDESPCVGRWTGGAEDLRALRAEIERLTASGRDALLIVDGNPPSLTAMQAARTIAQLLGVAS
jgi:hypothetical protein